MNIVPQLTEGIIQTPSVTPTTGIAMDVQDQAQFLGITPNQFLQGIGLAKADSKVSSPGVAGKPNALRGYQEPVFDLYDARGIRERYQPISFAVLREIERKNPVVSAITNTRCRQMRPFAQKSKGDDVPGFRISLRDIEKKPTQAEKNEMQAVEKWFLFTGRTDFEGWEEREDNLLDVMEKMARDYLIIDQIALEMRRDRKGKAVDFWCLDGATIYRTHRTGYRGSKNDFDPRSYIVIDDELEQRLVAEKIILIPDPREIRYVQRIHDRLVAAYTRKDMIFDSMQKRSDIRFFGYGYPPLEQAMNACTAFLFSMAYNAEAFNSGTLPKIALAFKDGNFSTEQLIALQDEWISNFRGVQGPWRIPMLNRDVNVIDLAKSPRDMEYMKYLEFMGSMICSVMGIDPMEIGMRWQFAQNVLNENSGSRLQFSKDRGLNDLLGAIAEVFNKVLMFMGLAERYKFEFTGIEPEDMKTKSDLKTQEVKTKKTVNELRAEEDLKPDPYGDIILDPTYLQYRQGKEQQEAQEQAAAQEQENADFMSDIEGVTDDALNDLFKAKISRHQIKKLLL